MYSKYVKECKKCGDELKTDNPYKKMHEKCTKQWEVNKKKEQRRWKYPKEFYKISGFIRLRDNFICQECGLDTNDLVHDYSNPPVHHIDGNIKNNKQKNLVTLCTPCHLKLHRSGLKHFLVGTIKIPKEQGYIQTNKQKHLFKGIQ